MLIVFFTSRPKVSYIASVANLPRGTSSIIRTSIRSNRIRGSVILKDGSPPPRSVSLGSGSGLVVTEDGYVVTNFHVVEIAYNIKLILE